jgi:type VI protein secretion system component VasK
MMLQRFLNTRIPSVICMLAFAACCLAFCYELMGARDTGQISPELLRKLIIWGTVTILWMFAFCLCLMRVTRYRRNLPDEPPRRTHSEQWV